MTATSSSIRTDRPARGTGSDAVRPLRALLAFDAATCIALGAVLVLADRFVARVTGLPEPLLVDAGIVLLAFAGCVAWAATRRVAGRIAVLLIVGANVVWAVASVVFAMRFADGATPLGRAVVIAQGIAVAALAALEYAASRRAAR